MSLTITTTHPDGCADCTAIAAALADVRTERTARIDGLACIGFAERARSNADRL